MLANRTSGRRSWQLDGLGARDRADEGPAYRCGSGTRRLPLDDHGRCGGGGLAGPDVDLTGIDVAVFGDCHLPLHHATDDLLIVHPGSVGAPFDADPTSAKFAVLDLTPDRVRLEHHAVPFDIDAANREIIEGRAIDINHSYYRKMTEIRLKVTSPNGEYWEPVPAPLEWRKMRQEV